MNPRHSSPLYGQWSGGFTLWLQPDFRFLFARKALASNHFSRRLEARMNSDGPPESYSFLLVCPSPFWYHYK